MDEDTDHNHPVHQTFNYRSSNDRRINDSVEGIQREDEHIVSGLGVSEYQSNIVWLSHLSGLLNQEQHLLTRPYPIQLELDLVNDPCGT